jgi:hypothetical protein
MAGDKKKKEKPSKEEDAPAREKEKTASGAAKDDDKETDGVDQEASKSALSRLRQRRWPIFFIIYVASCAWLVCMYDACDVKPSKLQDCGHSGIQYTECATIACFVKGGGKMLKKQVKLEPKGESLGLSVAEVEDSDHLTVTSVAGAAADYNSQVESAEDRILVGDSITKVGSSTKSKQMKKNLLGTLSDGAAITLSVQRSKVPWYLKWLGSKADFATSPGYEKWSRSVSFVGGYGLLCWLLSGYPPASLPVYYFSVSGFTALMLHRCCYNENVPDGKPHCHKSRPIDIEDAVAEAWAGTRAAVASAYKSFEKDPQKYLKSFIPKL